MDKVADGVYQIAGTVNSFVVDGDQGVTLVDTGLPNRQGVVVEALENIGRSAKDITSILLTHAHVDHYGSAASLWAASSAGVYASHDDAAVIRGDRKPGPPPRFSRIPFIDHMMKMMPTADTLEVDNIVAEGFEESMPGDFSVINTPGHTDGHLSYRLERAGGIVFVGDAAVGSKGEIKRGFFNRSTPSVDSSISHLAEFEFQVACFGHSGPIGVGASAAFQRFGG
jgi:glyoxylase-like metal-dependent hydrolase (beta-lactamase superfamily II)